MDKGGNTGNNANNPSDGGESDLPFAPGYGPLTPAYRGQDLGRHPDSASASTADDHYVRQSSNSAGYGNSDGSSFRPRPFYNNANNSSASDIGLPPPQPTTSGRGNDRNEASTSRYDHQNSNTAESNRAYRGGSKATAQDGQHPHFFVNAESSDETYSNQRTGENIECLEYPVAVTFIDRKTGTEYGANGEPIVYPDTVPICNDMNEGNHNPTGYSGYAAPQKPSRYGRYNTHGDDFNSSSYANPMGVTDDLPPPSYPQSMRENYPYNSSGYHPGPPMPYPPPVQANQGWASNQTTQISVVNQPCPTTMIVTDPACQVPDYLPLSIFVTLCCCLCLGICAIVKSSEARRLRDAGLFDQAKDQARGALTINIVGIVLGIIAIIATVIINFTVITRQSSNEY